MFLISFSEMNGSGTLSSGELVKRAEDMGLSNVTELVTILSVLPVTSCEAERSFNRVALIKDALRSTMTSKRYQLHILIAGW